MSAGDSVARRVVVAVTAAMLAAGVVGCGGSRVSGRAVFANHCEACHSLSGTASPVQQGGDLRGLHLPRNELVQFTVEMPIIHRRLTHAEVQAVVSYMQSLERRR